MPNPLSEFALQRAIGPGCSTVTVTWSGSFIQFMQTEAFPMTGPSILKPSSGVDFELQLRTVAAAVLGKQEPYLSSIELWEVLDAELTRRETVER